jgi:hypothetical protein
MAPAQPVTTDGRLLRSERTRQYIIEAYLALLSESTRVPTAMQIAECSGYSVRSLFERFPDLRTFRDVGADRQTRIRSQVETRGGRCERWLALWRAINVNQHLSPELKQRIRFMRDAVVRRLRADVPARAVDAVRSRPPAPADRARGADRFGVRARMRFEHEMSIEEACAVWIRAVDSLLPPTPADS